MMISGVPLQLIGSVPEPGGDMRMAVMAAGAVGGYFGARMAEVGHDVAFIARGAHLDAIRRDGLRIESSHGDLHPKDANITDDPKQVGPVEVVLFAVKLWDAETAGEQTRPLVGPNTRVITLQFGNFLAVRGRTTTFPISLLRQGGPLRITYRSSAQWLSLVRKFVSAVMPVAFSALPAPPAPLKSSGVGGVVG